VNGVLSVEGPTDLRRQEGKTSPPPMCPVPKQEPKGLQNPWLNMAEKGRMMAEARVEVPLGRSIVIGFVAEVDKKPGTAWALY